jgi:hypothetical protein
MNFSGFTYSLIQRMQKLPLKDISRLYSKNNITIGVAAFIAIYNTMSYIRQKRQILNAPPDVPYSLPFLGHMPYLIMMPNKFVDWCNQKYGEAYTINRFGKSVTMVSGSLAHELLQADYSALSSREGIMKGIAIELKCRMY